MVHCCVTQSWKMILEGHGKYGNRVAWTRQACKWLALKCEASVTHHERELSNAVVLTHTPTLWHILHITEIHNIRVIETEIWGVDMSPRKMAAATCWVSCSPLRFFAALICDASLLAISSFCRLSAEGACWRLGAITGLLAPGTKPTGFVTSLTRLRLANISSIFWSIYTQQQQHHYHHHLTSKALNYGFGLKLRLQI